MPDHHERLQDFIKELRFRSPEARAHLPGMIRDEVESVFGGYRPEHAHAPYFAALEYVENQSNNAAKGLLEFIRHVAAQRMKDAARSNGVCEDG